MRYHRCSSRALILPSAQDLYNFSLQTRKQDKSYSETTFTYESGGSQLRINCDFVAIFRILCTKSRGKPLQVKCLIWKTFWERRSLCCMSPGASMAILPLSHKLLPCLLSATFLQLQPRSSTVAYLARSTGLGHSAGSQRRKHLPKPQWSVLNLLTHLKSIVFC